VRRDEHGIRNPASLADRADEIRTHAAKRSSAEALARADEQFFEYLDCHERTGLLNARELVA